MDITLLKLVKVSLAKNTPKKVFVLLLKQLHLRKPIGENELKESLLELPESSSSAQLEYAVELACGSVQELQKFMRLLVQLELCSQRRYILFLKKNYGNLLKETMLKEFVNVLFVDYTVQYLGELSNLLAEPQRSLWYQILFFWGAIIDSHRSVVSLASLKELAVATVAKLTSLGDHAMLAYFSKKVNLILNTADLQSDLQKATAVADNTEKLLLLSVKKLYLLNPNSKKVARYTKLKKFIWLNSLFELWQFENLVERYQAYFALSGDVEEIVGAFFAGIVVAIELGEPQYVLFNWKNFIVSRLPLLLGEMKHRASEETVVSAVSAFKDVVISEMSIGSPKKTYDLRKLFLRSCVYRNLVSLTAFIKAFPEEADSVSVALITHETEQLNHVDGLTAEFNSKLLSINTEFTSLEESKLIDYFETLPATNMQFLNVKQAQLNRLVHSLVDTLVRERSHEKLSRLLLAMLNCLPAANFIFFSDPKGPWGLLNKLVACIDTESFTVDDDDSNFQDTYAYFGNILSGVISMSAFFGVDFASVTLKNSYTVEYINKFYFRLCDDLTSNVVSTDDEENTIVSNYNNLLSNWVNALFDVNNDGLSDDLIKSVNVKQIYKLIFIIFQQAITARVAGKLSSANLNNGIDYLSQNFLAPCSVAIIQWISSNVGPMHGNNEVLFQVLFRIIESNLGEADGDPNYSFRVTLNIVGPQLIRRLQAFKNWESTEIMAKLVKIVRSEISHEYTRTTGPLQLQSGGLAPESLAESLRSALVPKLRDSAWEKSDIANAWKQLSTIWKAMESREISLLLLREIDDCSDTHASNSSTLEEAKIVVDFVVFMSLSSSRPDEDASPNKVLPASNESLSAEKRFVLTMENHYLCIFNEACSYLGGREPASIPASVPKDELMMDFEMDDLFNDMSEDLFGGTVAVSRSFSPAAKVGKTCGESWHLASKLNGFNRLLEAKYSISGRSPAIAKLKVAQELEHWMQTMEV